MDDEEVPVPPQLRQPALHDFRGAPTAQRGFLMKNKRKLEEYAEQVRSHIVLHSMSQGCQQSILLCNIVMQNSSGEKAVW